LLLPVASLAGWARRARPLRGSLGGMPPPPPTSVGLLRWQARYGRSTPRKSRCRVSCAAGATCGVPIPRGQGALTALTQSQQLTTMAEPASHPHRANPAFPRSHGNHSMAAFGVPLLGCRFPTKGVRRCAAMTTSGKLATFDCQFSAQKVRPCSRKLWCRACGPATVLSRTCAACDWAGVLRAGAAAVWRRAFRRLTRNVT
jgi:hypothetical protein